MGKAAESEELFEVLVKRGYSKDFAHVISDQLNTTWTANRMLGYLRYLPKLREEDIVDEMLGILSDRERIREKKEMEYYQSKINELYLYGFGDDEEEDDGDPDYTG